MKREEYPRPQFVRDKWMNLNGEWEFAFDDENIGLIERWYESSKTLPERINVPFVYQTKLSGINTQENHEIVWYKKRFVIPANFDKKGIKLNFGAVDFEATVFLNGQIVGRHTGGHTSFSLDISHFVQIDAEEQVLTVRVFDPRFDERIPRGKQTWNETPHSIWYTNTTGIWQTVWLENMDTSFIEYVQYTTNIDEGSVKMTVDLAGRQENQWIEYEIMLKDNIVAVGKWQATSNYNEVTIQLSQQKVFRTAFHDSGWYWSPENPNLFDVSLILRNEFGVVDKVESYFGMRKIHTEKGMVYLNNKPYYQRLVLDQGYWPESLMTAPNDNAFMKDIELAKQMGFNGCRKHQKVEDPRFLYWADKLGFLVWGESPSAHYFSKESVDFVTNEWKEIIRRDYNHPSIITWVPFNESWGIGEVGRNKQQQHYTQALYHLLHALDTTRPVISNDGWELTKTDITAVHNYQHGQKNETKKFEQFKLAIHTKAAILASQSADRAIYADGFNNEGEPILLTEFGGIGYKVGEQSGWGYTTVTDEAEFLSEYERIVKEVFNSEVLFGFCYTQLYDVEQEINGLLAYDREPKCSLEKIREINTQYHSNMIVSD